MSTSKVNQSSSSSSSKPKPKFQFFSKRAALLSVVVLGAGYYFFSYRPYQKRRRHFQLEEQAKEYWKKHQPELELKDSRFYLKKTGDD